IGLSAARFLEGRSPRIRIIRPLIISAATLWTLFFAAWTFIRTLDWKDQRTFLTRTIADGGDSARMLINLGGLELSQGHLDEARQALGGALAKEPENPIALLNLAAVTIKQGDFPAARAFLKRVTGAP